MGGHGKMPVLEELTLMHYHLRRRLAQGGMSEVYLADDLANHCLVAIKLVSNERQEFYERFQREVETMAALHHDHILPAFDHGTYGPWYYMVMPYIEYGTLRDKLAHGPLSLKEAGMLLEQIADALQFAHDHALLHRDIKPSNILLRDGEHVYLADFGLVKHMQDESAITQTGCLIGTPEYMAPELAEAPATPQSDIYALGVVLYQMLTGRVPFKSQTPMGIYWKHLREQPAPPSQINPLITHRVEQVVLRALEKDPQRRYDSARAFADAYHEAIEPSAGYLAHLSTLSLAQTAEIRQFFSKTRLSSMWRTRMVPRALPPSSKVAVTGVAALFVLCVLPTVLGFTLYQDLNHKDVPQVNLAANVLFKGSLPPFPPTPTPTHVAITPKPTATKKPTSQPKTHTVSYTTSSTPAQNNYDPDHDGQKNSGNNNGNNNDGDHNHSNGDHKQHDH